MLLGYWLRLQNYDEAIFVGSETVQDAYTNSPFKRVVSTKRC